MSHDYKRYWAIVEAKLGPPQWRRDLAKAGDFKAAVFGYREDENPDATNMQKGKVEWEWEQKVWRAIDPDWEI